MSGALLRLPDRITVLNAAVIGDDGHGNPVVDWAHADTAVEPALVEPLTGAEYLVSADTIISRYKLLLHPKTAAAATSRVQWCGTTYEIEGEVQPTTSVLGRRDHCEAVMRAVADA